MYLLLSALDFPFCFAAVRYLGTDRIGHYEHLVVEWVKSVIPESVVEQWREMRRRVKRTAEDEGERGAATVGGVAGEETKVEAYGAPMGGAEVAVIPGYDHGVKEAEEMNKSENASKCLLDNAPISSACGDCMLNGGNRYLDATGTGIRHTQVFHLYKGTTYGRRDTQSRQSAPRLGLGYWEAKAEGAKRRLKGPETGEELLQSMGSLEINHSAHSSWQIYDWGCSFRTHCYHEQWMASLSKRILVTKFEIKIIVFVQYLELLMYI